MNRKDKRRRERLERAELARGKTRDRPAARVVPPPTPSHTPAPAQAPTVLNAGTQAGQTGGPWQPGVSANPQTQWQPGQSGNRDGYSRGRRFTDGLHKLITQRNADAAIAAVWLREILSGDVKFLALALKHGQDQASKDRDPIADVPPPEAPPDLTLDPEVAARMMAAAQPDVLPDLEEDETT